MVPSNNSTTADSPHRPAGDSLRWLLGLVRPYSGRLAVAGAALLATGGIALVLPKLAGRVVDAALVERSLEQLEGVILVLLVMFAVSSALQFTHTYILRGTASRLLRDLRSRLHSHLLSLSPAFFERERVGDLSLIHI